MSGSRELWPVSPDLWGWFKMRNLLDGSMFNSGNQWIVRETREVVAWRSVLPFLRAGLVTIEQTTARRRVMMLTGLGRLWFTRFWNHRASATFQADRARSMKSAATKRARRREVARIALLQEEPK